MVAAAELLVGHGYPVALLIGCRSCEGALVGQHRDEGAWRCSSCKDGGAIRTDLYRIEGRCFRCGRLSRGSFLGG